MTDLPGNIQSSCYLFADDAKIFSNVSSGINLQNDLNTLLNWSNHWLLQFNKTKCKYMHIGHGSSNEYKIGEHIIEEVNQEKDLGVTTTSNFSFRTHIEDKVNTANKILGIIRSFSHMTRVSLLQLYKALVRPHLEYCNTAWAPHLVRDISLLEGVQHRATKLLWDFQHLPYESRLEKLDLPSLTYRRFRGDLILLYKAFHNTSKPLWKLLVICPQPYDTRAHQFKLVKPHCNLNIRKYSFPNRIINHWNSLPEHIVSAPNLNLFKSRVDSHFKYIRNLTFITGYTSF